MELYQLDYILHEPREYQGWLYMAEIPDLPGCRAWGESANSALAELSVVAERFILSYKDKGRRDACGDRMRPIRDSDHTG